MKLVSSGRSIWKVLRSAQSQTASDLLNLCLQFKHILGVTPLCLHRCIPFHAQSQTLKMGEEPVAVHTWSLLLLKELMLTFHSPPCPVLKGGIKVS
jgi:hypothetical protein